MSEAANTWRLERHAAVRADAESLFVPTSELPDAVIGDRIVVSGDDGGEDRSGVVVELVHDRDVPAARVRLDPLR